MIASIVSCASAHQDTLVYDAKPSSVSASVYLASTVEPVEIFPRGPVQLTSVSAYLSSRAFDVNRRSMPALVLPAFEALASRPFAMAPIYPHIFANVAAVSPV